MKRARIILSAIGLLLAALVGCQGVATFSLGKTVEPEYVVPLPGEARGEIWEAPDLTIRYDYSEDGSSFRIDGAMEMSQHYREIYYRLLRAEIYLLFLDSNSTVLDAAILLDLANEKTEEIFSFSRKITVPPGAVAFSFSYTGDAIELDGRRDSSQPFWLLPQ